MSENIVKNRSEILFLYDVSDTNPNGDPDENRPRIDEYTGINEVTDVRLKRTIRDHLLSRIEEASSSYLRGQDIFVRNREWKGKVKGKDVEGICDAKETAKKFGKTKDELHKNILEKCIDVRLFGATIPLEGVGGGKGDSLTFTGPVQFNIGRSLHRVVEKHIKGTGGFASQAGLQQKTFRDDYVLPYSLICFYGIINENAAKKTQLRDTDVKLLLDGIWNGTKNIITRSKTGQVPRLLIKINYKEKNYHIGGLRGSIKLEPMKEEEAIRSAADYNLDFSSLNGKVGKNTDKILSIDMIFDEVFKHWAESLKELFEKAKVTVNVLDPDGLYEEKLYEKGVSV